MNRSRVQSFVAASTSNLVLDFRHAIRRIVVAPGSAAVVLLTLSVGIGAATAVFSVVWTVLLKPLPYPDGHRLVRIVERIPAEESPRGIAEERVVMDPQRVTQWRRSTRTLAQIAAYVTSSATVATPDGPSRGSVAHASREGREALVP